MGRKRKDWQKAKPRRKNYRQHENITGFSHARLIDLILEYVSCAKGPVSGNRISRGIGLSRHFGGRIKDVLAALERTGEIKVHAKRYSVTDKGKLLKATLALTSRGFGFATMDDADTYDKDVFIARQHINGASHGDQVLVRIIGPARGRFEGRVVKVLKRSITRLCGIFTAGAKTGYVTPDNERLPFTVLIRRNNSLGARDNTAVLVELIDFGSERRGPEGKILEVLGNPNSVAVQMRMASEQFGLAGQFPQEVLDEANALQVISACEEGRRDLRHIRHVTIDGADAKDFDDAISVDKTDLGFDLYVSIADVGYYIQPDQAIDREAYKRGTSFYLPDRVLPMLPERLSNNLCSLVPNQDRPAFTAVIRFNKNGIRLGQKFYKSMIRSRKRFTYETINQILYEQHPAVISRHETLRPMLMAAKQLAGLLRRQRIARGSIGFNIPEPYIKIENKKIISIEHAERNQAHQLIEEFMLAANEAVAYVLDTAKQAVLFRTHERPDPAKMDLFIESAKSMGLQLRQPRASPQWFAEVLDEVKGSPTEYVVNNLLLRTMQQARYTPDNLGHFGLAAKYYLHFTSPIRRYPDLIAHRVLHRFLTKTDHKAPERFIFDKITLADAGEHLSNQERKSVEVERNIHARLSALYMSERIGEEFDAVVSGVTSFGLYVELVEHFVSGMAPVQDMRDDYYIHDNRAHRLTGEMTGKTYQLGDLIRVKLQQVQILAKKIIFSIITNN